MTRLRLAFMGTPEFALPSLAALLDAGHEIAAVYSQPPRPAGRGQRPRASPVQRIAEAHGLSLHMPAGLKAANQAAFAALALDAAVVAAYGLLLPPAILAAPRLGCLNVHASLLPRWRGAAPVERAILAGDAVTGVTIMQMDAGLDTGPILHAEALPIPADATAADLEAALARLGARLVVDGLDGLATGRLAARPQPAEGVTYAAKLTRAEGRLDWRRPANLLARQVRAFHPRPGAWFEVADDRIRVLRADVVAAPAGSAPGTLSPERLDIACGDGRALRLVTVQRAGGRPMTAAEFRRGHRLPATVLA